MAAADDIAAARSTADLELLMAAAREAGIIAIDFFRGSNRSWLKSGRSPVSEADLAVNAFLTKKLRTARPGYGWISEESHDDPARLGSELVFIVDPIDGTADFIAGGVQWCVSIAVAHRGTPESGVVYCPALDLLYTARRKAGAWLNGVKLKLTQDARITRLAGSKRITEAINRLHPGRYEIAPLVPSLAFRVAQAASGEVDGVLTREGSHEWDVAAADIILAEAGGRLTNHEGRPIGYNRPRLRLPALVAANAARHDALLELVKSGGLLH